MPVDRLSSVSVLTGTLFCMLLLWLLYSAAMTLWTGVKPPRLAARPSEQPDVSGETPQPVVAERPISVEPAGAFQPMPAAEAPGALSLSRGRHIRRRGGPEEAPLAARAETQ